MIKSTVLIGFKHVGKSVVGRALALRLNQPFVDLDQVVETLYATQQGEWASCRDIMVRHGQGYFRALEKQALSGILPEQVSVIALGGGTPWDHDNQRWLSQHHVIHLCAPQKVVFERIMAQGQPAFFPVDVDPLLTFQRLWQERIPVYNALSALVVDNHGEVNATVDLILERQ